MSCYKGYCGHITILCLHSTLTYGSAKLYCFDSGHTPGNGTNKPAELGKGKEVN